MVTQRRTVPLSVALLNRRSVSGAIVVTLCALFFIVVLPAIDDLVEGSDLSVGVPLAVGESLEVTSTQGWVLKSTSGAKSTTLTNSGAQLVITPAAEVSDSVPTQIQRIGDALADDPDNSWVVAEPTTFTTKAGDSGAAVTGQSKESATQIWVVSNGTVQTTLVLTAPVSVWEKVTQGATDIVDSVKFIEADLP